MKRTRLYTLVLLVSTVFLLNTCSKDDKDDNGSTTDNCEMLLDAASNAAMAYAQNQTKETCEAYLQAITNYYEGCDIIPDATRAQYDQWLDDADCSVYDSSE